MFWGQQPNTKIAMNQEGLPKALEHHQLEIYQRAFMDGFKTAAKGPDHTISGPKWPHKKRWRSVKGHAPVPQEPEPALPGHFQYWSGPGGWCDYSCTEHQAALTNAWDQYQSNVFVNQVTRPMTLNLEEKRWIYKITLGELCEPPEGHADIVGHQVAVTPTGQMHRTRWVRLVGAENSNQISIMSPKHIKCHPACRPPNKPHS